MSKLTVRLRTQGKAVAALLKLYKADPDFAQELERLRTNYLPVLEQWSKIATPDWLKMRETLTQEEFLTVRNYFLTEMQTISRSLADKLGLFLSIPNSDLANQLDAYEKALADLAYRWQLKATWAGHVLLLNHILDMIINQNAVNKEYGKYKGRVMFPSSHDIIDKPEIKEACFIVIKKLLEAGNNLLITTKPKLSITKDIIDRFCSFKEQLQFRFTITSLDNQLLSFWEPNAPTYEERFESLKYAYENEFKTSVSIEPFLDYAPQTLISVLSSYITESIWLGPMNYIPQNDISIKDEQQYTEIRKRYDITRLKNIYEDLKDFPLIRFKDSMSNRLNILADC